MPIPSHDRRIRRVTVVTNAAAGALLADADGGAAILPELFAAAGLEAQFVPNDAGSLPLRIERALAATSDAVVVAGGDGTIGCAAHAMRGSTDTPLGILPFGTMNLLARDLGLPVGDTAAAIAVIAGGRTRMIDVAEVNGHVFLCAAMLGLPTTIGRHREFARGKTVTAMARMPRAIWRGITRLAPLGGDLTVDDMTMRVRSSALTITVNPVDDGSGLRFTRQTLDGGRLACYAVGPGGLLSWAELALRVLAGRWRRSRDLREWHGQRMVLDQFGHRALHVMLDGEMRLLRPPLDFICRPGALRISVP